MAAKVGLTLALDKDKEFTTGLRAATEAVKQAKAGLDAVKSTYDGNANSIEALTKKQEALKNVQDALNKKLEQAKSGLDVANNNLAKINPKYTQTAESVKKLESAMEKLREEGKENTVEYKILGNLLKNQKTDLSDLTTVRNKELTSYAKWQTAITKTNTEIRENEKELNKTDQYLTEAKNSADGCATSIDRFGKEAKGAGEETKSFADILSERLMAQFGKEQLFNLAVNGLRRIGQAAIDAAKECLNAGIEFNAQMSAVASVSNASGTELTKLSDKAKELGRTSVYSATEAGEAMEQLALSGWKTKDIISGIDGVLNLSASSSMDIGQAAEYVSDNINAFGRDASYATRLADIMAYAMSNSSQTTEDLGEAYGKVAATAHAFGFSEEEVTAVLMNMANAGKKGSEAGTALNTIMTRLAVNTSDCAVALEGVVGHDVIYDAQGNMRSLTDILTDLGSVWNDLTTEEQNNLSYQIAGTRQSTALRTIMAGLAEDVEGTGKSFSQYYDELILCNGAAQEMADIRLDNLQGDITLMNDALDGLGIAFENQLDGPLRTSVQGITDMINVITEKIDPQKTVLESFIEDLKTSNEEVDALLNKSDATMSQADFDVSEMEAYRDLLMDLNEKGTLTKFEQYQVKEAIDKLSDSVPGLASVFDTATNSISATDKELNDMFDDAVDLALKQAMLNAQQESNEALAQALINRAMAYTAVKEAQEQYDASLVDEEGNLLDVSRLTLAQSAAQYEAAGALNDAKEAQKNASDEVERAKEQINAQNAAFEELKTTAEEAQEELNANAEANQNIADSSEDAADAIERVYNKFGLDVTQFADDADYIKQTEDATQEIIDAYNKMEESVTASIRGCINMMSEWSGGDSIDSSTIISNLDSQIEGLTTWKDNMELLAGTVGDGMSQEMYDALVELGPSSANLIAAIAAEAQKEADGETNNFEEIVNKWKEAFDLGDDVTDITAYTSQGQAVADAYSSGLDLGLDQVPEALSKIPKAVEEVNNEATAKAESGAESINNAYTDGLGGASDDVDFGSAIVDKATEAVSGIGDIGTQAGNDFASALNEAMVSGVGGIDISGNVSTVVTNAITSGQSAASGATSIGESIASNIKTGIENNSSGVSTAVSTMVSNALKNISTSSATSIGAAISSGVAVGINANKSQAINAAINMATSALEAAKSRLQIHSPSRVFRDQVGKQVGAGFAFGIKDSASLASKEANKMSDRVYTSATQWLDAYKKKQSVSIADQIWYWQQIVSHTKKGSAAYQNAVAKVNALNKSLSGASTKQQLINAEFTVTQATQIANKIADAFNVAKTKKSGKKTVAKDAETYYKEVYQAAETYAKNQQLLNDWSLEQERVYWEKVAATLRTGTEGWYKAQEQIAKAKENIISQTAKNQSSLLDYYKTYSDVSLKAEMQYWDAARKKFATGTTERIEADQKYIEAKKAYYEELESLDSEYQDNVKDINDDLKDEIQDLTDTYNDAVKSRTDEILNSMSLFESYDTDGYTADKLISNLTSQVEALALWEQKLQELKDRGISDELYQYLTDAGIDGSANVYSIANMTDAQLSAYEELFKQRNELARSQAISDNEELKKETENSIKSAKTESQKLLDELNKTYSEDLKKIDANISNQLSSLLNSVGSIGEDALAALFSGMSVDTNAEYKLKTTTQKITTQLSTIVNEGSVIGHDTLQGILNGLQNTSLITSGATQTISLIKNALQEAADIHSPSRLMRDAVGYQLGAGIAEGLDDSSVELTKSSRGIIGDAIDAAQGEFDRRQSDINALANGIAVGGMSYMNNIMGDYTPETVVNVNNTGLYNQFGQLLTQFGTMVEYISNLKVVMDSGTVVGELADGMNVALSDIYARQNRGRK